ncbi:MAG: hypothetical protein U7126_08575 [Microcoleus sp.]
MYHHPDSGRNPVSTSPPTASKLHKHREDSKKPGFYEYLNILTPDLGRNPVSEHRATSKKPGFCDNLCIITQIQEETRFLPPHQQPPNSISTAKTPRNRVSTSI